MYLFTIKSQLNTGLLIMHIILMLALMLCGLSLGTNVSWFLGIPVMALSLLCFNLGSNAWREKQEGFMLFIGLCCGVVLLLNGLLS